MNRITRSWAAGLGLGLGLAIGQSAMANGNAYLGGKFTAEPHSHGGLETGFIYFSGSIQMDDGAFFNFISVPNPDPVTGIVPTGAMTFENGAIASFDLGPDPGALEITGNLILGPADDSLEFDLLPGGPVGVPRMIIEYSGTLTGEFTNVTPGFAVDYSQPGEIWVTAAPEPGAAAIVGITVAGIWRRRRD